MEGTTESQAKLEPRFRGRARAELGLLREEPGLEAREKRESWRKGKGGLRIGGGYGRAGARARARARARGPSFRFSQLFPWPAAGSTQGE